MYSVVLTRTNRMFVMPWVYLFYCFIYTGSERNNWPWHESINEGCHTNCTTSVCVENSRLVHESSLVHFLCNVFVLLNGLSNERIKPNTKQVPILVSIDDTTSLSKIRSRLDKLRNWYRHVNTFNFDRNVRGRDMINQFNHGVRHI